jgi:rare lipoprotein A
MSCARRRCALLAVSLAVGCATAPPPRSEIRAVHPGGFDGNASWYGREAQGGPTASGERFDMYALTAAHRTLPMGTRVRCENRRNGRSVVVRINDRGPYGRGRVIDLSFAAARALDMIQSGVAPVHCEVVR